MRYLFGIATTVAIPVLLAVTSAAGAQYRISVVAGQGQTKAFVPYQQDTHTPGQAYDPLVVRVTDAYGNPAPRVNVRFDCPANMGQTGVPMCTLLQSYNGQSTTVQTGSDGIATLNRFRGASAVLYYNPGTAIITASLPDFPGSGTAQFTLTGTHDDAPTTGTLKILSGGNQVIERTTNGDGAAYNGGAAFSTPVQLQLVDSNGNGVVGKPVCYGIGETRIQKSRNGDCSTTDASGRVTFPGIMFWSGTGGIQLTFGLGQGASFSAPLVTTHFEIVDPHPTAQPGRTITILSGDGQRKTFAPNVPGISIEGTRFDPLVVQVMDNGRPAPGVPVTFACPDNIGYGCSMIPTYNYANATVSTNEQGIATLNRYDGKSVWIYYAPASNIPIAASAGGVRVVFHLSSVR